MNADPNTAKAIFLEAVEKHDPGEWPAFLDQASAGQPDLRRRVEVLLEAHRETGTAADRARRDQPTTGDEGPADERLGTIIGPYKLLEQIGEGGFGVVFMAEQQQPIRRKVALKVIKPGMDTRQVIARFEAERQALALMDHPNIAKVLDAGTIGERGRVSAPSSPGAHETGLARPYFVMELVKGIPITDYCDQNQLTTRERLELFVHVCQAVQHAHQKGIIHRDIKPTNVLVTSQDGAPLVKVIDFGIAKAMGQQLTDKTLFTNFAQLIGTPLYMSPEQAALSNVDVDTRSDIYSLGVLLYELLTGTTPFDKDRFKEAGYDEMRRIIREEEPPKPSTRMSTLGQSALTVSAQRKSDPKRLSQLFRGELDWIVMKCLEKDRNHRYETAGAFAQDIQRYLADEPVQACPPSAMYRLRKFARRNKPAFAVAAGLFLAITVVACSIGWIVRDREAQLAAIKQKVPFALMEATRLQAQGKYQQALEATKRAEAVLAEGFSEEVGDTVRELRKDLEMVLRLEEIRLPKVGSGPSAPEHPDRDALYGRAFRDYGVDVEPLESAEAAARIRARGIWLELTMGLDNWALERRHMHKSDDNAWKRLVAVARAADPDPWRNQVRDAWERGQPEMLMKLVESPELSKQPAQTLLLLAEVGDEKPTIRVLRLAQQKYPDDFWINFKLAWALEQASPPEIGEAVRFFTVAVAIRPGNPIARAFLADSLFRNGKVNEAWAWYRIEPDPNERAPFRRPAQVTLEAHRGKVWALAFAPGGGRMASVAGVDGKGELKLWDLAQGVPPKERVALTESAELRCVAFALNGKTLATGDSNHTAQLRDSGTGKVLRTFRGHTGPITALAFFPDGRTLVTAGLDRFPRLWDVESGKELPSFADHGNPIVSVALSADGKTLATAGAGNDHLIKVWDVLAKKPVVFMGILNEVFEAVTFSPDRRLIASSSPNNSVRLWSPDPASSSNPLWWFGHEERPLSSHTVAFSPDGRLLAAGCGDETTRLWDVGTLVAGLGGNTVRLREDAGRELCLLVGHKGEIRCCAFSPDGTTLASSGDDGTIRFYLTAQAPQ